MYCHYFVSILHPVMSQGDLFLVLVPSEVFCLWITVKTHINWSLNCTLTEHLQTNQRWITVTLHALTFSCYFWLVLFLLGRGIMTVYTSLSYKTYIEELFTIQLKTLWSVWYSINSFELVKELFFVISLSICAYLMNKENWLPPSKRGDFPLKLLLFEKNRRNFLILNWWECDVVCLLSLRRSI